MSTTLTIGGSSVSIPGALVPTRMSLYAKDGIPTLTLQQRGGALPGLPDPYLGKSVVLAIGGTTCFTGDVVSMHPTVSNVGRVIEYQCLGLRNRGDRVPYTDGISGTDTGAYNVQLDLQPLDYVASRAGRTVGQILTDMLTGTANATNLNGKGIGAYTSLGPPTLPAATVTDLAAMTLVPPGPVYVSGEKLLGAVEAFVAQWAPNYCLWIDPATGALRFLDLRTFSGPTFTEGTDPIELGELSREWGDCYARVTVRGQPIVKPILASLSNGLLAEDFTYGSYATNAAAIAAWSDAFFTQSQTSQDQGTCTCPSTTTVTVTSASGATAWPLDFWDQSGTGRQGTVHLKYSIGTGITQYYSSPIVANTALTAGGSSTLTLADTLPITTYDSYTITGLVGGESLVWRKYSITNSDIAGALANQFQGQVAFVAASGNSATLTSYPMGSVLYSASGSAPYNETPLAFTQNPSAGYIIFNRPTWELANHAAPQDVRALLAVNVGVNTVTYPADIAGVAQYSGTSHSVEGLTDTLTVTVDSWRDPANATAMAQYAQDLHDSVCNTIVEGTVVYHGLYTGALTMGLALSVTGNGYTTGWESLALAVLECELEWGFHGGGSSYITRMHCSNRRAALTAAGFMHPDRTGLDTFGLGGGAELFGAFGAAVTGAAGGGVAGTPGAGMSNPTPDSMMPDEGMTPDSLWLGNGGNGVSGQHPDKGPPLTPGNLDPMNSFSFGRALEDSARLGKDQGDGS